MPRKLILDGNTVYELDEECMLQHKSNTQEETLATRIFSVLYTYIFTTPDQIGDV